MGGKQKETTGECRAAIPHVSVACSAGRATKRQCWGSRAHICFLSSARLPERNVAMLRSHRSLPSLSWRVGQRPHGAHLPLHTAEPPNHLQQPSKHNQCQWVQLESDPCPSLGADVAKCLLGRESKAVDFAVWPCTGRSPKMLGGTVWSEGLSQ